MATLTIRNIEPALKERLRMRAARNGRSMEAELRTMLMAAICDESERDINLAEAIRRRFRRFGGIELETHPAAPVRKPPALDP